MQIIQFALIKSIGKDNSIHLVLILRTHCINIFKYISSIISKQLFQYELSKHIKKQRFAILKIK